MTTTLKFRECVGIFPSVLFENRIFIWQRPNMLMQLMMDNETIKKKKKKNKIVSKSMFENSPIICNYQVTIYLWIFERFAQVRLKLILFKQSMVINSEI